MASELKLGPAVFCGMLEQKVQLYGEHRPIYETLKKVDSVIEIQLNLLRDNCLIQAPWDLKDEESGEILLERKKPTIEGVSELYSEINEVWKRGSLLHKQLTVFKDQFDETAPRESPIKDKDSIEDIIIEIDRLLKVFKLNHLDETATKHWERKNIAELYRDFVRK